MLLVRSILSKKIVLLMACSLVLSVSALAQENSPFSRYGLGDIFPGEAIQYRAIGGMTAAQGNPLILNQPNVGVVVINPNNPASYGFLRTDSGGMGGAVTYDLGVLGDMRTLKRITPSGSYNSSNLTPAYFSVGVPLHHKGMGLVFGIKPITRISYNVTNNVGFNTNPITQKIDSFATNNHGEGGLNKIFVGVGKSFGNLRVGINGNYNFGKRSFTSLTAVANDSFYYNTSLKEDKTTYRGLTWDGGIQYTLKLKEIIDDVSKISSRYDLDLGVNGSLSQKLNATHEAGLYTAVYGQGDVDHVNPVAGDTVSFVTDQESKVTLPFRVGGGFMLNKYINNIQKYGFGAEYSMTQWEDFRGIDNQQDPTLSNSYMVRAGGYFIPDPLRGQGILSTARYSLGGYYGSDYVNVGNNSQGYNVMGITLGVGILLRNQTYGYRMPFSIINTAFEFGKRGNNSNNISENFYKISVGFSLRDIWLVKRRYD